MTGVDFREAANHFEAQAGQEAAVQMSGSLKSLACALMKIANDIRWLGSGPRLGLGELILPAVQPGSSIMPGKVNPVIAEALIMVCAQVIGNDSAITLGGLYANFQLNTMLPLIARNLIQQIRYLTGGCTIFTDKLLRGLTADRERIKAGNERSWPWSPAWCRPSATTGPPRSPRRRTEPAKPSGRWPGSKRFCPRRSSIGCSIRGNQTGKEE